MTERLAAAGPAVRSTCEYTLLARFYTDGKRFGARIGGGWVLTVKDEKRLEKLPIRSENFENRTFLVPHEESERLRATSIDELKTLTPFITGT